ncbi:hypothetical protein AGMMS50212_15650 [Spirochaetia bacterium]|nr:hypothetical protein AGMMS50212_15650 [Spirochaetia bacterium]
MRLENPFNSSFIFWGVEPTKPIRYETIESHLEKALAALFGEVVMKLKNTEWQELTSILATKFDIQPDEMIAVQSHNLDTTQNCVHVRYSYSYVNKRVKVCNYAEEKIAVLDTDTVQRLAILCGKNPYVLIFGSVDRERQMYFGTMLPNEAKKLTRILGEIIRRERNISFHSFRHFFNSTIRGTVSDDILRLQTGHITPEMTDLYDHMTDDRGDQLRKAIQTKILPFIPNKAV